MGKRTEERKPLSWLESSCNRNGSGEDLKVAVQGWEDEASSWHWCYRTVRRSFRGVTIFRCGEEMDRKKSERRETGSMKQSGKGREGRGASRETKPD